MPEPHRAGVSYADGMPVLAGYGGTSIRSVFSQIVSATDTGADAAAVTPYYLPVHGLASRYWWW